MRSGLKGLKEKFIEAKEVSLGTLFSEQFLFRIPIYQRPLSWNRDNFEQLFEDIKDSMDLEEGHFLGSIILQEVGEHTYELVDGQQRMVALTILLAVIRDITNVEDLKEHAHKYIYQEKDPYKGLPETMRVTPWKELEDLFRKYIYTKGGTKRFLEDFREGRIDYKDTEDPVYHIWEAINTFTRKIEESEDLDLEDFVRHMLTSVYVVCIKTKNLTTAYRLFNVLNTRGLPLTPSDLLKSENLGAIEDEKERERYGEKWLRIERNLGREELANVISYIRMMVTKEKARLGIYEEYRRLFKKGILERGAKFIDLVEAISDIYDRKILSPEIKADPEKANRYKNIIELMRRFIPFSDWIPPLLAFYYKFKSDEYLASFLLKLEKKTVMEWLARFTPSQRITSFGNLIKLIEKSQSPEELINEMDKTLSWLDEYGYKSEEGLFKQELDDRRFYSRYRGKLAKYVLLRIDMERWDLENFPGYPGTITVEHILPQNPSKDSEWVKLFTKEERDEWTNKLGNLVLLSKRKNSRAQNYDFKRKKEVYFEVKRTPFLITQELDKINEWNLEELSKRHNRLIKEFISIYSKV